ncbi:MAG: redoxin domain-containing protein [Flavobacteriaceae bacterium]|nr:redoxin domain-containing protein [Flavobacteriaceae bacterium]
MRKYIKIIIALIIISIIGYLGVNITKKITYKKEVSERIKIIPNFSFFTLNNVPFSEKELAKNTNKLFVYFNTECDFCQHEAQQISEYLSNFKNTQIIFVSFEEIETIKTFANKYNLSNKENVMFLQDKTLEFSEIFDAKSIPFILLYDAENKLVQKFKGATKIEKILKLLK